MGKKLLFTAVAIHVGVGRLFAGLDLDVVAAVLALIGIFIYWINEK